jgi:hypothetical protein
MKRTFTFEVEDGVVTYIRDGLVIGTQPESHFSYLMSRAVIRVYREGDLIDIIPSGDEMRTLRFGTIPPESCKFDEAGDLVDGRVAILKSDEVLPTDWDERVKFVLAHSKEIVNVI